MTPGYYRAEVMTKLKVLADSLFSLLAWAPFGTRISDMCTGFWGYRGDAIWRLELAARGFEIEAAVFAECIRIGLRIAEIPSTYSAREQKRKLASLKERIRIGLFLCGRRTRLVNSERGTGVGVPSIE